MPTISWDERVITLGDGEIHYWVHNAKSEKTLFFLHGAGIDHQMFNDQYQYFGDTYNLVTWDARWHGASRNGFKEFNTALLVSDLDAVMAHENLEKCIFIGQSMGGNLAQAYALQFENKTEGLVLIDCTKNIQTLTMAERILWTTAKPIFFIYPWSPLVNSMARACSVKEDVQKYIKNCLIKTGKSKFITILMSLNGFLQDGDISKYPKNILLICGERDQTGNIKREMAE